jgi:polyisoprenoid-binding protein YceI
MMKRYVVSLALAGLFAGAGAVQAQSVRLAVGPDSKLWVEGGSNLHDWSCKATSFEALIDLDESILKTAAPSQALVKKIEVKVPVRNLKCGNGKMDGNLYKALKADDAPQISYILGSFETVPTTVSDSFSLKTVGALTIAGTEKPVNMDVTAKRLSDGSLRTVGEVSFLMTDFGVKPPTALLGTLRTANKVTVKFELLVGPQAVSAAAAGDRR